MALMRGISRRRSGAGSMLQTMRRATLPSELPSFFRKLRPGGPHAPRVAWCEDSEVTA
jgi:hypothetical protein